MLFAAAFADQLRDRLARLIQLVVNRIQSALESRVPFIQMAEPEPKRVLQRLQFTKDTVKQNAM
jgi:hypothetical protein